MRCIARPYSISIQIQLIEYVQNTMSLSKIYFISPVGSTLKELTRRKYARLQATLFYLNNIDDWCMQRG